MGQGLAQRRPQAYNRNLPAGYVHALPQRGFSMMTRFRAILVSVGLLLAGMAGAAEDKAPVAKSLPAATPGNVDFQRDIQPIFERACLSCHGPVKQRSGLRLDRKSEALKGGDSGVVIRPADAEHSRLLLAVEGLDPDLRMPPEGN